ncbi:endonuclease III [Dehalogenimonas sp. WBC-2]|nr:endonuclease III [Dehalogenimonas sp. WBC-2]
MGNASPAQKLTTVYQSLMECYGHQSWWPAQTPFEMMVGAVLTQSAAWSNVEKAIANLESAAVLSPAALRLIDIGKLARLVYPSGYYNAKAGKLKALAEWLGSYGDDLTALKRLNTIELRRALLGVHGIGLETADSILLYALDRPVFVIDAYTRRLFERLGIRPEKDSYDGWQALFMANLPVDLDMFNEYHALIVRQCKEKCRKLPRCGDCCFDADCQKHAVSQLSYGKAQVKVV